MVNKLATDVTTHEEALGNTAESFGEIKDEMKILRVQMADLVAMNQSLTDTVTALQRELRTYFMPPNATRHAYRMVGELKHTRSLRDYVRAYQRLMLDLADMQKQDKQNWFILGLQSWAQSKVEKTLEDAYVVAKHLADTQRKNYTNAFKPAKKPEHGRKKEDQRERKDGSSTQHQVEKRTFFRKNDNSQDRMLKCWFCEGSHLARQCPKRLNRNNQASSSRESANAAQGEEGE
ncbi:hypothetical protein EJ110_NYTH49117 [Nymphaea thermarum]|nr:hypothetical protein EJ110_NYTH49117 [Nymphaea thermarum]